MCLPLKDGRAESIVGTKLVSPYVVRYHDESYKYDLRLCTDVLDALASSAGRVPHQYLSLMDANYRAETLEADKGSGGRLLSGAMKDKPFPSPDEWQSLILYWVDVQYKGKQYRIMVGKDIVKKQVTPPSIVTLVREGQTWLQSTDLDDSGIEELVAFENYESLRARCSVRSNP